ncbi:hypothetical protein [Natronospira sp.]|uniref:hypothetical protein n=1 Tax=Natronospira sp. TaxID=2024970 RepID=UPI003873983F
MSETAHQSNRRRPRLRLHFPGLFDVGRVLVEDLQAQAPALPGLHRLLARGDALPADSLQGPGQSQAALALLGEGKRPRQGYWLRADPVHLRPDQDFLLLWDGRALDLDAEEADALVGQFNQQFAEDGWRLEVQAPDRWYLAAPGDLSVETTPVAAVTGRNINHFMPAGPDRVKLEQLINETQMLFHDHPVNQARTARGLPTVSGVWPWGGGRLDEVENRLGSWASLLSNDPVWQGLAQHQGCKSGPEPASFSDWRGQAWGDSLVVIETGTRAALDGDGPGWQAALEQLDRDWWQAALRALGKGELDSLELALGPLGPWHMRPGMRWRFWRRERPLWEHLAESEAE